MDTRASLDIAGLLLALSGWGKVAFDWLMGTPRIRGRVFAVMEGQMENPGKEGEYFSSFVPYLYLVNERRNSVHMLDYQMEIELGGEWIPNWTPNRVRDWISMWLAKWMPKATSKSIPRWILLHRAYGVHQVANWTFTMEGGGVAQIEKFGENLINRKDAPVEYGKPLHGWLLFVGDVALYKEKVNSYRVTCIDAFQKKHVFRTRPSQFDDLPLLQDIAGIRLPGGAKKNA